jgi:hypothetical protein
VSTADGRPIESVGSELDGGFEPVDVLVDPFSDVWAVDAARRRLVVFSAQGKLRETYGAESTGIASPAALALGREDHLFVLDDASGIVHEMTLDGQRVGRLVPETTQGRRPVDLAANDEGCWILDAEGAVLEIWRPDG